jgi:hypothetical protein
MLLVYQPDRQTQLRALLEGKDLELVGKAYNGRKFTFATAKHSDITSFTTAEEQAVFTVNIHDLIEHALISNWHQRAVYHRRIGGDGSTYMLLEAGLYKYMFTERNYTTELFVSANVHDVLEAYLANDPRAVKLEGINELKALREHLWKNPYE